jgi:CcmD family protein
VSDPSLPWLFAGFAVVWVLLGGYLVRLWRAQRDIARRLESLDAARPSDRPPPAPMSD